MQSTQFHIGTEPQLFVDSDVIEVTQGLARIWHQPERLGAGPVLAKDRPWESLPYFNYSNQMVLLAPAARLFMHNICHGHMCASAEPPRCHSRAAVSNH